MTDSHPDIQRTREIELASNRYVIHPLSRRCVAVFERWGVHPNVVSLFGMVLGAGAAVAYYHFTRWPMVVLGGLLMLGWHVMDGADGQLARRTGKTSELGKMLDGLCDHGTFILVYAALALALMPYYGGWIWLLAGAAGVSHAVQAGAYEFQRQAYDYWVHGKGTAPHTAIEAHRIALKDHAGGARLIGRMYRFYLRQQRLFAGVDLDLHQQLAEARDDGRDRRVEASYRSVNLPAVWRWSILSSNPRTVAIFMTCLAGMPQVYFWLELVVLNVAYLLLLRMQYRLNQKLIVQVPVAVENV